MKQLLREALAMSQKAFSAPTPRDWDELDLLKKHLRAAIDASEQEPMFWVRICSDGMYEGPIHNARIESVRSQSGAWSPLYLHAAPQQPVAELTDDEIFELWIRREHGDDMQDQVRLFARAVLAAQRWKP